MVSAVTERESEDMPKIEAAERRDRLREKAKRMPVHGKSVFTIAEARRKREAKLIRRVKGHGD